MTSAKLSLADVADVGHREFEFPVNKFQDAA